MPWFDQYGWASLVEIPGRFTATPIPEGIQEGYAANWTGYEWRVVPYSAPPNVAVTRLITKRAFWNRFPAANEVAMRAVMLSGTPVLLAASLERLKARVDSSPFVDLDLPETIQGVQWLASVEVPESVTFDGSTLPFRVTLEQVDAILNAVPTDSEKWAG